MNEKGEKKKCNQAKWKFYFALKKVHQVLIKRLEITKINLAKRGYNLRPIMCLMKSPQTKEKQSFEIIQALK